MSTKTAVIGTFDNPTNLDIFQTLGPGGNVICGMNYQGLIYPISVPVVQNSLLVIDTNKNQSVSNTAIATSLYSVAVYGESYATGAGGTTTVITIAWTNAQGNNKS